MIYPIRVYKGRKSYFISMTYSVEIESITKCQGWGVVESDVIYSLGDRFMSSRPNSNTIESLSQEYFFIDFECDRVKAFNPKKILKSSLDIRKNSIKNKSIPLVIIDNKKDDLVIGVGRIDFLKRKIELDMLEALSFKILGFFV